MVYTISMDIVNKMKYQYYYVNKILQRYHVINYYYNYDNLLL